MTLSATRTPALGAAPPTANIPYGRLSRPNSDPSGISIALTTPPLLIARVSFHGMYTANVATAGG